VKTRRANTSNVISNGNEYILIIFDIFEEKHIVLPKIVNFLEKYYNALSSTGENTKEYREIIDGTYVINNVDNESPDHIKIWLTDQLKGHLNSSKNKVYVLPFPRSYCGINTNDLDRWLQKRSLVTSKRFGSSPGESSK